MTQDEVILLLFKVFLVVDVAAVLLFVGVYSYLSPWLRNPIGRTLVVMDLLLAVAVIPSLLSLFWHFNRLTSHVAAWVDVAAFAAIGAVLLARVPLWIRLHLDKDGQHTYAGMWPFARQVAARRGRPLWKDWTEGDA